MNFWPGAGKFIKRMIGEGRNPGNTSNADETGEGRDGFRICTAAAVARYFPVSRFKCISNGHSNSIVTFTFRRESCTRSLIEIEKSCDNIS